MKAASNRRSRKTHMPATNMIDLKGLENAVASVKADIAHLTGTLSAPIMDGTPCILLLAGKTLSGAACQQVYGNWPTAAGMVRGYRYEDAVDSYMTHVVCMSPARAEQAKQELAYKGLEVTVGTKAACRQKRLDTLTELLASLERSLAATETSV